MKKTTKIGIIGAGHVGSHVASSLMTQGLCDEIVLLDTDEGKARRHADDIADSVAYMPLPAKIYAGGYEALADADIVVLSACSTIFEQDRLLELDATVKVIAEIAPQLTASGFSGIVVSISNPCDVIAQYFARITGLNVVGTGTALDSARLCRRLAAMLGVSPHSVCAYELGEHGVQRRHCVRQAADGLDGGAAGHPRPGGSVRSLALYRGGRLGHRAGQGLHRIWHWCGGCGGHQSHSAR